MTYKHIQSIYVNHNLEKKEAFYSVLYVFFILNSDAHNLECWKDFTHRDWDLEGI